MMLNNTEINLFTTPAASYFNQGFMVGYIEASKEFAVTSGDSFNNPFTKQETDFLVSELSKEIFNIECVVLRAKSNLKNINEKIIESEGQEQVFDYLNEIGYFRDMLKKLKRKHKFYSSIQGKFKKLRSA